MCDGDLWSKNGNPLRYSCLDNVMDRVPWQVTVLGVAKRNDLAGKHNGDLWGEEIIIYI